MTTLDPNSGPIHCQRPECSRSLSWLLQKSGVVLGGPDPVEFTCPYCGARLLSPANRRTLTWIDSPADPSDQIL